MVGTKYFISKVRGIKRASYKIKYFSNFSCWLSSYISVN